MYSCRPGVSPTFLHDALSSGVGLREGRDPGDGLRVHGEVEPEPWRRVGRAGGVVAGLETSRLARSSLYYRFYIVT